MTGTNQVNGRHADVNINQLTPGVWNGSFTFISIILAWLSYTFILPLAILLPLLPHTPPHSTAYTVIRYATIALPVTGVIFLLYSIRALFTKPPHQHIDPYPFTDDTQPVTVKVKRLLIIVHGGKTVGLNSQHHVKHIVNHTILPLLNQKYITYTTIYTEYPKHAQHLITTIPAAELQAYTGVLSCGGDGLFAEIVNGLLHRSDGVTVPLGIIPLGTGNSYMHDLQCFDNVKRAVKHVIRGETYDVDVNLLTDEAGLRLYSTNTVGFGIVGETAVVAESHRYLRGARYDICAIWILLKAMHHSMTSTYIKADTDKFSNGNNKTLSIHSNHVNLAFVNQTQHFGNGLRSCPYAKLNDGKLDVVWLIGATRVDMLKLFLLMPVGQHTQHPCVKYEQCESVTFVNDGKRMDVITVDGENVVYTGKLNIVCEHKAVRVFAALRRSHR